VLSHRISRQEECHPDGSARNREEDHREQQLEKTRNSYFGLAVQF